MSLNEEIIRNYTISVSRVTLIEPSKIDFDKMTRCLPLRHYYMHHLKKYHRNVNHNIVEFREFTNTDYEKTLKKLKEETVIYVLDQMEEQVTDIIKTFTVTVEQQIYIDNYWFSSHYDKNYEILYTEKEKVKKLFDNYYIGFD